MTKVGRILLAAVPVAFAAWVYYPITANFFHADDFPNLFLIQDSPLSQYLLKPHGGHILLARNFVFFLNMKLGGPVPSHFFWPVLITNGFDQGLRFSVDRPTYELLYLPIAPGRRVHLKNAIDIVVNRIADAIGAVLFGVATMGFFMLPGIGLGVRGTAVLNLALIGVWLAVASRLRVEYVRTIQDSIHRHRLDTERAARTTIERSAADATGGGAED